MARRYANVSNTSTFSPETSTTSTPVMAGGTQAVAPEVGYAGSFAPQMSAPINFSVQGGGAVGAGKTVRGSRLGRGGPELTRPVSGNVTMGNVSISSTMSPTFSNIGNVDASVKGVSGGTQTQTAPVFTGVGETPRMAGGLAPLGGKPTGPGPIVDNKGPKGPKPDIQPGIPQRGAGGESVGPRPTNYVPLPPINTTKQPTATQPANQSIVSLLPPTGGSTPTSFPAPGTQTQGPLAPKPPQQVPYAPGVTPPKQTTKQPTATQPANQSIVSLLPPTGGSTPTSFPAPGTQTQGPFAPKPPTSTATGTKPSTATGTKPSTATGTKPGTATSTKAKAEKAKAKAQQVVKAKETVKTAKETPKEDRTKADKKALEAAKAKLQLERLQAEKEKAERTKKEQREIAEAKAKAQAAAEAAAKAKAKAQAAKKSEPAKNSKKK